MQSLVGMHTLRRPSYKPPSFTDGVIVCLQGEVWLMWRASTFQRILWCGYERMGEEKYNSGSCDGEKAVIRHRSLCLEG